MNAHDLLIEAQCHGAQLVANGERLKVVAPTPLPDSLLSELRRHKPELLRLLSANDPGATYQPAWTMADHLEDWNERVGIMMDSGIPQDEAERLAWERMQRMMH